jgi:hypothetical protein
MAVTLWLEKYEEWQFELLCLSQIGTKADFWLQQNVVIGM